MYSFSENGGGKLPEQEAIVFHFFLQKCLLLFLQYIRNYFSSMSEIFHCCIFTCFHSKTIGFIRICFTNWDLQSFSHGDLLRDYSEQRSCTNFHVSLFHFLVLKFGPQNVQFVIFLEHIQELNLELYIPSYSNIRQVSCLGMNSGRG